MVRPFAAWPAAVLLLLAACQNIAPPPAAVPAAGIVQITAPETDRPRTASVYIVRRSWHIDIGFAVADLQPPLRAIADAVPQARYLEFGFGDRRYLMTRDHGTTTLLAAVWPGASLVLMTALKAAPQEAFGAEHVMVLHVRAAQAASVQNFIRGSMTAPVADGPYPGSVFYGGTRRYSGLHTCNTWAAEALRAGSLRIRSTGVLFAGQLWSQVQRLATEMPDTPGAHEGR